MRTAIYCGSFDPVHKGHEAIVNALIDEDLADKVVIVPTMDYWDKNGLAPLVNRMEMLKMVVPENVIIDSEHNSILSTNELFETYLTKHPDEELSLVIGGDNLLHFDKWINYQKLLEYRFIITCREPYGKAFVEEKMAEFHKTNYVLTELSDMPVSSSFIRENIADGDKLAGTIDPKVYEYICENGLYKK